jgi:hypothetical protein
LHFTRKPLRRGIYIYQEHHYEFAFEHGRPVSCRSCGHGRGARRVRDGAVRCVHGQEMQRTEREQVWRLQGQMQSVQGQVRGVQSEVRGVQSQVRRL